MSDETERPDQNGPPSPPPEADGNTFSWGKNQRGDLRIVGVIVEKNPHGVLLGPEGDAEGAPPAAANADEMAEIRRERDELRNQFDAAEPYIRISGDPIMREILNERIARGEIEAPRGPAPSIEDSAGFQLRASEPEFEAVREVLRQHAATLPEHEAEALDNNPRVFNEYYDKVKATLGDRVSAIKPRPPILPAAYPNVPLDRRAILASIASKEVNKAQARVEPPGSGGPEYPPTDDDGARARAQEYGKAKERFAKARQFGNPTQVADAEAKMVEAFFAEPPPKRGGVRGA